MTYEEWLPVIGFSGYEISNQGRVKSLTRRNLSGAIRRGRILKQDVTQAGYCMVRPARDGYKHARLVHRLVLEAFVGKCTESFQTRHLNGKRKDNNLSNLRWGSIQENKADQKRHGTGIQGSRNPKAKLVKADIERVFDLRRVRLSQQTIGDWLGFNQTHVSTILLGRHYLQATIS